MGNLSQPMNLGGSMTIPAHFSIHDEARPLHGDRRQGTAPEIDGADLPVMAEPWPVAARLVVIVGGAVLAWLPLVIAARALRG